MHEGRPTRSQLTRMALMEAQLQNAIRSFETAAKRGGSVRRVRPGSEHLQHPASGVSSSVMLSRRTVLKLAASVPAALAAAPLLRAAGPRVVVIGAGAFGGWIAL